MARDDNTVEAACPRGILAARQKQAIPQYTEEATDGTNFLPEDRRGQLRSEETASGRLHQGGSQGGDAGAEYAGRHSQP